MTTKASPTEVVTWAGPLSFSEQRSRWTIYSSLTHGRNSKMLELLNAARTHTAQGTMRARNAIFGTIVGGGLCWCGAPCPIDIDSAHIARSIQDFHESLN